MGPIAGALGLLLVLAHAEDFSVGKGPRFDRKCEKYVKAELKPEQKTQKTVEDIASAYMQGAGSYVVEKLQDANASPEIAPWYPGASKLNLKWSDLLYNNVLTHDDLNEVRCVIAHEAAHAGLKHSQEALALQEERAKVLMTEERRKKMDAEMIDYACKPDGKGGWSGFKCPELRQSLYLDILMRDPVYFAMARRHEIEADLGALRIVSTVQFEGKTMNPRACWAMVSRWPAGPPPKPEAIPDQHPAPPERARLMAAELAKMGAPEFCP